MVILEKEKALLPAVWRNGLFEGRIFIHSFFDTILLRNVILNLMKAKYVTPKRQKPQTRRKAYD